jgi:hypothetical protein
VALHTRPMIPSVAMRHNSESTAGPAPPYTEAAPIGQMLRPFLNVVQGAKTCTDRGWSSPPDWTNAPGAYLMTVLGFLAISHRTAGGIRLHQ